MPRPHRVLAGLAVAVALIVAGVLSGSLLSAGAATKLPPVQAQSAAATATPAATPQHRGPCRHGDRGADAGASQPDTASTPDATQF